MLSNNFECSKVQNLIDSVIIILIHNFSILIRYSCQMGPKCRRGVHFGKDIELILLSLSCYPLLANSMTSLLFLLMQ